MIQNVDDTLFHLLAGGLTTLGTPVTASQIRFQPPDADWRAHLATLGPKKALNVYLADIRENRRLRSNERTQVTDPAGGGDVWERPAPARADCHYLITAWSNADEALADADHAALGRTGSEHEVLHDVASLLSANQPLAPADVFGGVFPAWFADDLKNAALPTTVLPVEGFAKYAEFWGTMGEVHPWKPAVYVVVTVPLATPTHRAGPPVTTLSATYGQNGNGRETLLDIGGRALDDATGAAVPGAFVRLLDAGGASVLQAVETDGEGRFRFDRLVAGAYRLQAGAAGIGSADRTLDVPSPNGEYDLRLA